MVVQYLLVLVRPCLSTRLEDCTCCFSPCGHGRVLCWCLCAQVVNSTVVALGRAAAEVAAAAKVLQPLAAVVSTAAELLREFEQLLGAPSAASCGHSSVSSANTAVAGATSYQVRVAAGRHGLDAAPLCAVTLDQQLLQQAAGQQVCLIDWAGTQCMLRRIQGCQQP
jgi:hypothetical protein